MRGIITKQISVIKLNKKFSLTFDEWTSVRNRRYLNIILPSTNTSWNLGLSRVMESVPAEKCVELIENKLNSYNLSLKSDIVCITTDGAAVMKKVGRLIMVDQVICLAHGIHLAVVKVLYSRNYNCEDNNENVQCTSPEILDDNENYEDEHDFYNAADSSMIIIQNYSNESFEEFETLKF